MGLYTLDQQKHLQLTQCADKVNAAYECQFEENDLKSILLNSFFLAISLKPSIETKYNYINVINIQGGTG